MTWEKKRIIVVAKAYPEFSVKHGSVVCTAGITEDGEWIRLYPLQFSLFTKKGRIPRYSIIECECKRATDEKLQRKESYRIRPDSVKVVDTSMCSPPDWEARSEWIHPKVSSSIEQLYEQFDEDRSSLGLVRPIEVISFYKTQDLEKFDVDNREFQVTIEGKRIPVLTRIPHIFKYRFKCGGCGPDQEHNIQCEDWELLESYRSWGARYEDIDVLWDKIHEKYFEFMLKKRDLHFYMGMHSQFPSWMIIGLYYPPKVDVDGSDRPVQASLLEFVLE
jgi:hypothetical protein